MVSAVGDRTEDIIIRRWELGTGKELGKAVVPHQENRGFCPFTFSPDGETPALEGWEFVHRGPRAFSEYRVHLWDVATGRERLQLDAQEDVIWSAAFSPDGKMVAAAGMDHAILIWDVATRKQRSKTSGHPQGTRPDGGATLAFAPDGKTLAAIGSSAAVHIWDVATGRALFDQPDAHHADVAVVSY